MQPAVYQCRYLSTSAAAYLPRQLLIYQRSYLPISVVVFLHIYLLSRVIICQSASSLDVGIPSCCAKCLSAYLYTYLHTFLCTYVPTSPPIQVSSYLHICFRVPVNSHSARETFDDSSVRLTTCCYSDRQLENIFSPEAVDNNNIVIATCLLPLLGRLLLPSALHSTWPHGTAVCYGVQWRAMVFGGVLWCTMVCYGVQRCATVYSGVR